MPLDVVIRPEISLLQILVYALIAFAITLLLTPRFVQFLLRNKIGKQLRVETIDGREPAIFRSFHKNKHGTPTMGGVLIWVSIVCTVLLSRLFSFMGWVDNSLLQRGQVYLPLFALLSLGILGGLDDYLNIISTDEKKLKQVLPRLKWPITIATIALLGGIGYLIFTWESVQGYLQHGASFGLVSLIIGYVAFLAAVALLSLSGSLIDQFFGNQKKQKGLGFMQKILSLLLVSLLAALWFYLKLGHETIHIPLWGDLAVGWWYVPIFMFIFIGTTNAVNFTDGLDGLAGGLLTIAFGAFGVLAYVHGLTVLAAFCAVCVGAIAAFLWHNVPPALFFMGDTGALALGGALAVIAMMIDQALVLPLIGFIFMIEVLSVIIQLTSKKLRNGKKVFRSAPIHHHFEALEWGESKVTMRFWIVGSFTAILGIIIGIIG